MEEDLYDEFGNYIGPELQNMVIFVKIRTKKINKKKRKCLKNQKIKINQTMNTGLS